MFSNPVNPKKTNWNNQNNAIEILCFAKDSEYDRKKTAKRIFAI
jgi:hypothetical protein